MFLISSKKPQPNSIDKLTRKEVIDSYVLSLLAHSKDGLPRIFGKRGLGSCQGSYNPIRLKLDKCWNRTNRIVANPTKGIAILCCHKCAKRWLDQVPDNIIIFEISVADNNKDFEDYIITIKGGEANLDKL